VSKLRFRFITTDSGGGDRWRSVWPAEALQKRGYQADVFRGLPLGLDPKQDVVISHRPLAKDLLRYLRAYREAGIRVLLDEDDDLNVIPDSFDRPIRRKAAEVISGHDRAIQEADGLIVTTDHLREVYGPLAKRTWVLPNLIPRKVGTYGSIVDDGKVRVGWAGITKVHRHDLWWLKPVMKKLLRGAMFTTVGDPKTPEELGLEDAEVFTYQKTVRSFYWLMARADIGIVPLHPAEKLNLGKSGIKALEYMILGKPVVAVKLPEQQKVVVHGESGFLASTPNQFAGYVQRLVRDPDLRRDMGAAAKERADLFTLETAGHQWSELAEDLERTPVLVDV
jgi:glycosyltransferase involved in cell wall biosynthesis